KHCITSNGDYIVLNTYNNIFIKKFSNGSIKEIKPQGILDSTFAFDTTFSFEKYIEYSKNNTFNKYFFGCIKSSHKKNIIVTLNKYNKSSLEGVFLQEYSEDGKFLYEKELFKEVNDKPLSFYPGVGNLPYALVK